METRGIAVEGHGNKTERVQGGHRLIQIRRGRCASGEMEILKRITMSRLSMAMHVDAKADGLPIFEGPTASEPGTAASPATARTSFLQRVFSFQAMLASLLVAGVFIGTRLFIVDPDLWWHVKAGEFILATHHWPMTDPYSFTVTGHPWLAYEWLGEMLLATVSRLAGVQGLDALLIILGSTIILALYYFATLRSGNSKAGFVASSVLLILATPSFSLRPQMLGYLFLILTLTCLELFRQGKRGALCFLPVIMLLWVNTHGSWIIGLGSFFVYWMSGLVDFRCGGLQARRWATEERIRLSFTFLLCLVVLPITPYGTRIAVSPFEFAFSLPVNVAGIQEWQPMPFNLPGGKVFLVLLLAFILVQVAFRFTWWLAELALFLFGTMMACLHLRFLLIFVPFCAPLLATIVARWMPSYDRGKDKWALNAVLMAVVAAGLIYYFPSRAKLERSVARQFPVKAVAYLEQHPVAGPMFNTYGFGGYLVWSRGPQHKVFIDGRGDVYERGGVLSDYLYISSIKPGALAVLDGYGVQSCLLEHDEALTTLLSASPQWRHVYTDDVSSLFVRTGLPGAPTASQPGN
jgi:hypothetical protein